MSKNAVVLVSGGLDSATVLAIALVEGYEVHALTFAYGQRHAIEIEHAKAICASMSVEKHIIVPLDMTWIGGSALTDRQQEVPKNRSEHEIGQGIPSTYVPARNAIFLTMALAYAEANDAFDLFIGVNALDYSGYPDCRPIFIKSFEQTANLATRAGVEKEVAFQLHTPLLYLTKEQIVRRAQELNVDLALTYSCYDPTPEGRSCGLCDSCLLRAKGFAEAGVEDPALEKCNRKNETSTR